jgi:hypothetical protein
MEFGTQTRRKVKTGDAAVNGLLAGLAGGAAMLVFLVIAGLLQGDQILGTLGAFAPSGDGNPFMGALAHIAVSAIYGAVFGVLMPFLSSRIPFWIAGASYGLLLFLVAKYLLLPGAGSVLLSIGSLRFGIAHAL